MHLYFEFKIKFHNIKTINLKSEAVSSSRKGPSRVVVV